MTKIVQIAGGLAGNQNAYAGPERELTATTDSHELRLHDGATAGGHRFLPKSTNDLIYQSKSSELDKLAALTQERGFMTRAGAASYLIRQILGVANEVEVANGDGFAGNVSIGLPTSIDKVGLQFVQDVAFLAEILGTLRGNVIGNVTGNLTGNADGAHTGLFTGDVDVRGATIQLDDGQIPMAKISPAVVADGDLRLFPSGGVIIWSGSVVAIPNGWVICDGANGTPDLRDKFIIGASSTGAFSVGDQGGAQTHTHVGSSSSAGSHAHTITVNGHAITINEMPQHEHGNGYGTNQPSAPLWNQRPASGTDRFDNNTANPNIEAMTSLVGGGQPHPHTASSANAGAHTHPIAIQNASSLPPYYALCFIMKT